MKLVLFDIDGTLVNKRPGVTYRTRDRFVQVFEELYGFAPRFDWQKLDGQGDRKIFEILASDNGIGTDTVAAQLPRIMALLEASILRSLEREAIYEPIADALTLIKALHTLEGVEVGVLSGNFRPTGRVKLNQTGLSDYFHFDIYAEDAPDRQGLAALVVPKAIEQFGVPLVPGDVYVIGDTVHDVRAGKSAGLHTIVVNTGPNATWEQLAAESPELLVKTLVDPRVFEMIASSVRKGA
jgi:phosphoglycolate phosphatase-like HAD superfamily hydrolase